MAQLGSPGVQVNVIDESFYNPATPGTIPLVVLATAQDKTNASGTGIAPGTQAANANVLYLATSQKDLTDRFGVPTFQKDASGNAIQGSELNEYGLFAAYSYLGASNSAYVLRANVDLNALKGSAVVPVGNPATGSYWVDTNSTRYGIFEWDSSLQQFNNKVPLVLNTAGDVVDFVDYKPKANVGSLGDYAVVTYSKSVDDLGQGEVTNDKNTVWYKNSDNQWVKVGSRDSGLATVGGVDNVSTDWTSSWATVESKAFSFVDVSSVTYTGVTGTASLAGHGAQFTISRSGDVYTIVAVTNGGAGYTDDEQIVIAGSALGGTDGINDLTIIVNSPISQSGAISAGELSIVNPSVAATFSNLGMKIEVGPYDRSAPGTSFDFIIAGGNSGSGSGVEASPQEIVDQLNLILPASVQARVRNSKVQLLANADVYVKLSGTGLPAGITSCLASANATDAATAATPLGLREGTYNAPSVAIDSHTKVPFWNENDKATIGASTNQSTARPSGSIWVKTTEFNLGARWSVKRFNGDTRLFESKDAPVYKRTEAALAGLDPLGGGTNIAVGSLFVNANFNKDTDVNFRIMTRANSGATTVSNEVSGSFAAADEMVTIGETVKGSSTLNEVTFAVDGQTIEQFVALIQSKGLVNVTASYNVATNTFTLTHALGGDIFLKGNTWNDLIDISLEGVYTAPNAGMMGEYDLRVSNWKALSETGYVVDKVQPTSTPADGTLWYSSYQDQVDIMIHDGSKWAGYAQVITGLANDAVIGPYVQATKPTTRRNGSPLLDGEIWVDTSNSEVYGHNVKRWNDRSKTWDAITVSDHTSQYGIIYSDARWATTGASSASSTITELAKSSFVDFDAPDPVSYPRGMLLWNTRRSGMNIKQYKKNYINTASRNTRMDVVMTGYYEDRWVSVSGADLDQVAYFGRKAQRAYVVGQLKVAINTNQRILDEDNIFFNLIACPGYPELISDMVNLNSSRNGTALVVGDTPLRLESTANSLINYGTDYYNTGIDGEAGLHTNSDHLAVYYPSGLATDLTGTNVVVPPSHMMLRTIAVSDQRSFQWFAPAGTRRGGVTNATSVGYLKDGSFIPVSLNQGTRDQMAQVKINPITNIPGAGLVAFGQYTKTGVNSSLDRINVARLVSYLRRQLGIITKPFLFEPNDKQTRSEIKNVCESLMLDLVSLRGIYDFIVVCDETNNTPSVISNNQLYVDIAVEPVKAVEFIYIPLRLKNVGDIKSRQ